jgi:hypothetical protein
VTRLNRLSATVSVTSASFVVVLAAACHGPPDEQVKPLDAGSPAVTATGVAKTDGATTAALPVWPPPPDGGRADLRAFCTDAYAADNARLAQKCTPKDLQVSQGMARAAANLCVDDTHSAVRHGRASFDADAAKHCVQMLQDTPLARSSDSDTIFAHYPCDSVLLGQQAEGQPCLFSVECKEGLACEGYAIGVDGVCKKPPKVGEACIIQRFGNILNVQAVEPHHPACAAGAWCDGTKCQPRAAAGKPCKESGVCAGGLSCVMGKCGKPAVDGAACAATSDCTFGSICEPGGDAGAKVCAPRHAAGAPCTAPEQCKGRCDMTDAVDAGGGVRIGHCSDVCGSG